MITFFRARLAMALVVLVTVTVLLTLLTQLIPGDPVTAIVGPRASPAIISQVRHQMGLDRSVPVQVFTFLSGVVRGNLGTDFISHTSVTSLVLGVLPHTLILAVSSLALALVCGIPLGVYAATHRDGLLDKVLAVVSIGATTMPAYVAGLLLLLLFAVKLRLFPTVGLGNATDPVDYLRHLVLPSVALAITWIGYISRLLRSSMIEALGSNYVRSAESFGIRSSLIQYKYALRNAIIPTVAVLGVGLGNLVGGAIFVEVIFARAGLGSLMYDAITSRNFPVMRGSVLVVVLLFVLANLVADVAHRALDPRIRHAAKSRSS